MTYIQAIFPDEYIWLSRIINSYPGASNWYDSIFYVFVWLLDALFKLTANWGWALILFTLIIKILLYPLTHSQTKSMVKRRLLEKDPDYQKIMKIKDNQEKQQKLMKFYKEKKVNPAGGCLPILVQMPIFFLLFAVLRYQSELFAFGPQFLFWTDLSIGGFAENILLVLISVVISFFTSLLTSSEVKQAKQSILFAFFPFLFIGLATGLQIYWVFSAVFQFFQTLYIYEKYHIKGIQIKDFFASFKRSEG